MPPHLLSPVPCVRSLAVTLTSPTNPFVICRRLCARALKSACTLLNSSPGLRSLLRANASNAQAWRPTARHPAFHHTSLSATRWPQPLLQAGEPVRTKGPWKQTQGKPQAPVLTRHLAELWKWSPRNTGLWLCVCGHCPVVQRVCPLGRWEPGARDTVLTAFPASEFLAVLVSQFSADRGPGFSRPRGEMGHYLAC